MLRRKGGRQALSILLAGAMIMTSAGIVPKIAEAADPAGNTSKAAENGKTALTNGAITADITTDFQVKIGSDMYDLNLYGNGLFETKAILDAGSYSAELYKDGVDTGIADTFTIGDDKTGPEDKPVYFRVDGGTATDFKGTFEDSINSGFIHSENLPGNFGDSKISFYTADGTKALNFDNWNPSCADSELTYVGGDMYKGTYSIKDLTEAKSVSYKVAEDDAWSTSYGKNGTGDNIDITVPAGTEKFTVLFNRRTHMVYDSIGSTTFKAWNNAANADIEYAPLDTELSVIGPVRCSDGDWDITKSGFEMNQISDRLFTFTKRLKSGSYSYKVVFNKTNWYEKHDNKALTLKEDKNVTFVYNADTQEILDTVNDGDALAALLNIPKYVPAGSIENDVITGENGTITFQYGGITGDKVLLTYGTRADLEANSMKSAALQDQGNGKFQTSALWLGDEETTIYYYYTVNGEKKLDLTKGTTSEDGKFSTIHKDKFTGRTVTVPGTFPGPSWDASSNQMTYKGNQKYEYTFTNVAPAAYQFKIALNKKWDPENYGADGVEHGENIVCNVPKTMDVTVYYNDLSHKTITNVNYIFADITLTGKNIPNGTKLTDDMYNGIYSGKVTLPAGKYDDIQAEYNGKKISFGSFELKAEKSVTFYFDPDSEIAYSDATESSIDASEVVYDTHDTDCKSIYGAIPTDTDVTFGVKTGSDVTAVKMIIKGANKASIDLNKTEKNGKIIWKTTTRFNNLGQDTYFFAVYQGSSVKVYGDDDGYYGKGCLTELGKVLPYDLIVYDKNYKTPDWMKNAVVYQIFPDRFANGNKLNDKAETGSRGATKYEFITDWNKLPENPEQEALIKDGKLTEEQYAATGAYRGDGAWSNEIYGGDIEGVIEHINYLKALGVNVIYFNPSFSSISSHRYDTSDYSKIDPILGDLGDFKKLSDICDKNGMHIVLDGVFNHVSDDSVYFDRYYKYLHKKGQTKIGAYPYWAYVYDYMADNAGTTQAQAEKTAKDYFTKTYGITDFSYTEWFDVKTTAMTDDNKKTVSDTIGDRAGKPVYTYEGWWGYDSMPVIKATNGSEYQTGTWAKEIIKNEDPSTPSITQYWLEQGSDGWRLDVANEVSDETWHHFRESVKALNNDNIVIGEIWTDATHYLLGDMYDSVMNYVFRGAVINYAKGGKATDFTRTMEKLRERYPKEAFYAMMNLLDSHDTTRLLSYLDGIDDDRKQKDLKSAFPTYENTSDTAKQMQYEAALLQFTYPGAPTVYYGDEMGAVGADDPDDRRTINWGHGNEDLVRFYATLGQIRAAYPVLRTGDIDMVDTGDDSVLSYIRTASDTASDANMLEAAASGQNNANDHAIVLLNNSASDKDISLDLTKYGDYTGTYTDALTGNNVNIENGKLTAKLPAYRGIILVKNPVKIALDTDALSSAYSPAKAAADEAASIANDKKDTPKADPVDPKGTPKDEPKNQPKQDAKASLPKVAVLGISTTDATSQNGVADSNGTSPKTGIASNGFDGKAGLAILILLMIASGLLTDDILSRKKENNGK